MCLIQSLAPLYSELTPLTDSPPPLGSVLVAQLENRVNRLAEVLRAHHRAPWCPVCLVLSAARTAEPHLPEFEPYPGAFAIVTAGADGSLPRPELIVAAVRRRPLPGAAALISRRSVSRSSSRRRSRSVSSSSSLRAAARRSRARTSRQPK